VYTRSIPELRRVLDHGQQLLNGFPAPSRTDNHFIVDPAKWDFYAMDAYRLVGDDELAKRHAHEVLHSGISPEGIELSPMRVAEAGLTLGVVAADRASWRKPPTSASPPSPARADRSRHCSWSVASWTAS
jgi:hypothetical protein